MHTWGMFSHYVVKYYDDRFLCFSSHNFILLGHIANVWPYFWQNPYTTGQVRVPVVHTFVCVMTFYCSLHSCL